MEAWLSLFSWENLLRIRISKRAYSKFFIARYKEIISSLFKVKKHSLMFPQNSRNSFGKGQCLAFHILNQTFTSRQNIELEQTDVLPSQCQKTAELCTRISISFGAELRLLDDYCHQEIIDQLYMPAMLGSKAAGHNLCSKFLFNAGHRPILWALNLFYVLLAFYMRFDSANRVKLVILESKWGVLDWLN